MPLGFHVPPDAFAADGDVTSTVEITLQLQTVIQ